VNFPERIYTLDELKEARAAIASGYKHEVRVVGNPQFNNRVSMITELIKLAGYWELLKTFIREIRLTEGVSQLRETEASIWLNQMTLENPIEGARFIMQKVFQMQSYIEGKAWYIMGELPAVKKSICFLKELRSRLQDTELKAKCSQILDEWTVDKVT
jgi:hypothetical protein